MAWNEPGGNGKNNDPWGSGGGDKGPPDLDEAFRKFQKKLNDMFSSGGSGPSAKGPSAATFGILIVVLVVAWALLGVYKVDEQERGVVLRFGSYVESTMPGLRWNPPIIDSVTMVNVTKVRSASHRALMLTVDENIVEVAVSVQYTVADPKNFVLKVLNPERSLAHATESAMRHVVGSAEMHQVLTEGRGQIAIEVQQRIQDYVNLYETGISVTLVNVEETQPPEAVLAAFDDVIKAKEDEERVKNEAESYRNGIVPEARGQAQRQLEEARAYRDQVISRAQGEAKRFEKLLAEYNKAPEVTRQRLYLDSIESVMSHSTKVMIDVDGGNNMIYLPLDKLIESSSGSSSSGAFSRGEVRQITDSVVDQLRRDNQSRRREGR